MAKRSQIIHTEAGNVTVGSSKRHGDGDHNYVGSEISLLPLNDKCIHAEDLFLNCIGRAAVFLSQQISWQDECELVAGDPTEDIWVGIRRVSWISRAE